MFIPKETCIVLTIIYFVCLFGWIVTQYLLFNWWCLFIRPSVSSCPSVRMSICLFIRPSVRLSTFFFENNTWIHIQNQSKYVIQEINVWLSTTKVHVDFRTWNNCAIFLRFFFKEREFSLQNVYKCWKNSSIGFAKIQHHIKNTIFDIKY